MYLFALSKVIKREDALLWRLWTVSTSTTEGTAHVGNLIAN